MAKKRSQKLPWLKTVLTVLATVIILVLVLSLVQVIVELVKENFGPVWLVFLLLIIALTIVGWTLWSVRKLSTLNQWFLLCGYLMLSSLLIGIVLLESIFSPKEIQFYLNNASSVTQRLGEITCPTNGVVALEGYNIGCEYSPLLNITSAQVGFVYENGTTSSQEFSDLYFMAPPDVKRVEFFINGIDNAGHKIELSTASPFHFPSEYEHGENQKDLVKYLLGLLAVVAFSIPAMVIHIRDLYRD